jgi:hypothetical protein
MFARKIVPILLVAGAVHMMVHYRQSACADQPVEGEARGPQFRHGPFARRGDWANRVPPMFEMLHNRAHAAQNAAQSSTPAI